MSTQHNNRFAGQTGNRPQPFNQPQPCSQPRPNKQPLTDEKIKEIVMETLIELNLVPKPEKRRVLTTV